MAGSQISTGVTIINSLKGFQAISLTNYATSAATAIATGSVVEVAGAFFSWAGDETPTGWAGISTTQTAYIALTPSGTAGSQIVSASYTATAPTWRDDNQGWYTSAGSSIRVVGGTYKTSATQYDNKFIYVGGPTGVYGVHGVGPTGVYGDGDTYGVYGAGDSTGVYGAGTEYGVRGHGGFGTGVEGFGFSYDFYADGAGTNYGPFTGAHDVFLSDDTPEDIEPGMIVSATGEVKTRDGSISSTAPTVRLSSTENDRSIFGVYVLPTTIQDDSWLAPWKEKRTAAVNALGEGRVLVTDVNGELKLGDWVTSSTAPGYGMKQDDDLLHSYTVAKVTETVDWSEVPGKKKHKKYLIACTYVCG